MIFQPAEEGSMGRKTVLMHDLDNVATVVEELHAGETVNASLGDRLIDVEVRETIPFGHKIALSDIREGEYIFKFGLAIGKALNDIKAGEWISVHNCRSHRYGFHNEQYGIRA
jgi:altronate dehydratase small subunit